MTKKKQKEPVFEFPKTQLWVVERQDVKPIRKIYIFAEHWYDARQTAAMKLDTRGDFSNLFISAVMANEKSFYEEAEAVYEVRYTGNASSGTREKHIITHKER